MPVVHVNDIDMYYELAGAGPPLVVIPGLAGDISEWHAITDPLAERFRVLAFDNRGGGQTDKPDAPYTIEQMASDAAGLLRAVGVGPATVLGVSMGGRVALALALDHPELVSRLILVSTGARASRRRWLGLMGLASGLPLLRGKHPQPRYAFRHQRAATTAYNAVDRLGEIQVPTTIMHGKSDRTAPLALAEELHAGIAGSRLLTFPGGHLFLFFRERARFLDAVVQAAGG